MMALQYWGMYCWTCWVLQHEDSRDRELRYDGSFPLGLYFETWRCCHLRTRGKGLGADGAVLPRIVLQDMLLLSP